MPPPKRWEKYSALGKIIRGTNLIAFKVPLKQVLLGNVSTDEWFTPSILIQQTKDLGIKLGLVIDLTNTDKYYNPLVFTEQSILFKKLWTEGHFVPSDKVYTQFASTIKQFDKEDHVIGVHCTHGVNRTGYLICRYMIEELNVNPNQAIDEFARGRGYGIERDNYLEDLKSRIPGELTVMQEDSTQDEQMSRGKRKPRWRHHREDHPGWRSSTSRQHEHTENFETGGNSRVDQGAFGYCSDVRSAGHRDISHHSNSYNTGYGEREYHRNGNSYQTGNDSTEYSTRKHNGYRGRGYDTIFQSSGFRGRGYHSWNLNSGYWEGGYHDGTYGRGYQGAEYHTSNTRNNSRGHESGGYHRGLQSRGYHSRGYHTGNQGEGYHNREHYGRGYRNGRYHKRNQDRGNRGQES